jgi:hypothetical protein
MESTFPRASLQLLPETEPSARRAVLRLADTCHLLVDGAQYLIQPQYRPASRFCQEASNSF